MRASLALLLALMVAALSFGPATAHAGADPAEQALEESMDGRKPYNVVQNRFFLKEDRFELSPMAGYVPNNPFVRRYIFGVLGAYHLSETFAIEGAAMLSPDLGTSDVKDLTRTLVLIANESSGSSTFQQPLNKMTLGATFAARWAPVYGKINLIGESVLNFDFYFTGGLGILTLNEYRATSNDPCIDAGGVDCEVIELGQATPVPVVPVNLGVGMDFFLTGSLALKLDARNYFYFDKKPQYDPDVPVTESRLYNAFLATVGVSVYFPRMKPRLFDY